VGEGDYASTISTPPAAIDSTIHDHAIETGHTIGRQNWKIISKDSKRSRPLIRESLAIVKFKPTLNKTVRCTPLIIYPEGEAAFKPKVKMKIFQEAGN
jgi:hypothetical protein